MKSTFLYFKKDFFFNLTVICKNFVLYSFKKLLEFARHSHLLDMCLQNGILYKLYPVSDHTEHILSFHEYNLGLQ